MLCLFDYFNLYFDVLDMYVVFVIDVCVFVVLLKFLFVNCCYFCC